MDKIWRRLIPSKKTTNPAESANGAALGAAQLCRVVEQQIQKEQSNIGETKENHLFVGVTPEAFMDFWLKALNSQLRRDNSKSSGEQSPKTRMFDNLDPSEMQLYDIVRSVLWSPIPEIGGANLWQNLIVKIFSHNPRERITTTQADKITPSMVWLLACRENNYLAQVEAAVRYFGQQGLLDERAFRERLLSDIAVLYAEEYQRLRQSKLDPLLWWNGGIDGIVDLERIPPSLRLVIKELLIVNDLIGSREDREHSRFSDLELSILKKVESEERRQTLREALAVLRSGTNALEAKMSILLLVQEAFGETTQELQEASAWLDWESRKGTISFLTEIIEEKTGVGGFSELCASFFTTDSQSFASLVQPTAENTLQKLWARGEIQALMASEPLLKPYLESLFTGDTSHFSSAMYEMLRLKPHVLKVEKRTNQNQPQDIRLIVRFKPSELWGRENAKQSVLDVFTQARHKTLSTPVEYTIPIASTEWERFSRLPQVEQTKLLVEALENASQVAVWQHGFSSTPEAAQPVFQELFAQENDERLELGLPQAGAEAQELSFSGRTIGLAMATKGSQNTALEVSNMPACGDMRDSTQQIADMLKMLGLVGRDGQPIIVYQGHSMGGQEAMLLPLALECQADISIVPLTPVMNRKKEHLKLLQGVGDLLTRTVYNRLTRVLPRSVVDAVGAIGDMAGLTKLILARLLQSSPQEMLSWVLQVVTAVHTGEFEGNKSAIIGGIVGLLNAVEVSSPQFLSLLKNLYGDKFLYFLIGDEDAILNHADMVNALLPVFEAKVRVVHGAPHYLQLIESGMQALKLCYLDGFQSLQKQRQQRLAAAG